MPRPYSADCTVCKRYKMHAENKCSEKAPNDVKKSDISHGRGTGSTANCNKSDAESGGCVRGGSGVTNRLAVAEIDVELEQMMDVKPSTSTNDGGEGSHLPLTARRYEDPELSPESDYNLLDVELPDQLTISRPGGGGRWIGKRISDRSRDRGGGKGTLKRDIFLQTFAHTLAAFTGEFVGTLLLTLCIITAVAASVIANALSGIWQVAVICGLGVALSIYISAHISDAHLNPAVTIAFAVLRFRIFSWKKIAVYIVAQMCGGFFAGAVLYGTYYNAILAFEEEQGIERGKNGSELSAMIFGEYFPNPAVFPDDHSIMSPISAVLTETWATAILVFIIFAFTDPHNTTVGSGKHKVPVPILIGATVMVLISLYGPLTQAGLNPARDFGPRMFAAMVGWGNIAIPGPRSGFWVYIVGPLFGGLIGGALYDIGVAKAMKFKMRMKSSSQPSREHHTH